MARDRTGFVNRSLRGLRLSSAEGLEPGTKLFSKEEAGQITSIANSPGAGPIALGYIKRGHETPGTVLHVGSADGPITATVSDFPLRR
jgi:glycine cleavage system aminomethyltransferase T